MGTASSRAWVVLTYRLPREPSAPRLAVWRRLKRLGVAKVLDGVVALPLDSRNREHLEWTAEQVTEAGGVAGVWIAEPTTAAQSENLAREMQSEIITAYLGVLKEARAASALPGRDRRRILARLRRELGRIRRRDYFPPDERESARTAVEALAGSIEERAA